MVSTISEAIMLAVQTVLAVLGMFVREVMKKSKSASHVISVTVNALVGGFIGVMVYFAFKGFHWPSDFAPLVAGIAGYIGPSLLDQAGAVLKSKMPESELNEKEKEK